MEPKREFPASTVLGLVAIALLLAVAGVGVALCKSLFGAGTGAEIETLTAGNLLGILLLALGLLAARGFLTVQPNQAVVLVFLGKYIGTVRKEGFWWINPFAARRFVSLRVRNLNSDRLKVNDSVGNPIEIGAVVVWRVADSAQAVFDVDSYEKFVEIQSETAIRTLAIRYPYDAGDADTPSLRSSQDEVAIALREELQARLQVAGVEVIESRLSYLAYAPEIAQVMLRRQQAQAVVAARQQIIEGALGMVELSLQRLNDGNLIELDPATKAALINNLLVVLTSEQNVQPIIDTRI
ncbi:SPFH domain-containing protein [Leptolyngbya sp. O-77]|uniref:SPFH domain-containing protein n=1 Tax=Leptolyngbya sp. O-77 TaxID=1080068 RepID=UPI00074D2F4E|nr:SPFH domain-containing protein [Leptolyngbya sp. O-77]BAU41476.1 SPFH domain / Band 7 family protein [Leptolyngbya sp. O-77]